MLGGELGVGGTVFGFSCGMEFEEVHSGANSIWGSGLTLIFFLLEIGGTILRSRLSLDWLGSERDAKNPAKRALRLGGTE